MLSQEMRQHFRDNWKGVKIGEKRVYVTRTKRLIKQTLEDLTLVASKLPEKHQTKVFTAETVMPLIKALVAVSLEDERRLKRVRKLSIQIVNELSAKSHILAPQATKVLIADRTGRDKAARLAALAIGY